MAVFFPQKRQLRKLHRGQLVIVAWCARDRWNGRFARLLLGVMAVLGLLGASGCGISGSPAHSSGVTEVTLWTWQSTILDFVQPFEKLHPDIKIKVVNAGSNNDEYMQLSNAIEAGNGIPDLVYLDYNAVQQFAVSGHLRDVGKLGFSSVATDFTQTALDSVQSGKLYYGLPISSGPLVFFYNESVFREAGISEPPTTWNDYLADARLLKQLGKKVYIANDTGDTGMLSSLLWQAGAQPFVVDGTHLSIDFTGNKVKRFTRVWQRLLDEHLIDTTTASWSDDWYRGLESGNIASIISGAWMVTTLKKNLSSMTGQWRMALLPQYEGSDDSADISSEKASAENGGGALALPKGTDETKVKAAYRFAQWYAHEGGVDVNLAQDGVPPLKELLKDQDYLEEADSFFGGQKTHKVIAQSAAGVREGWHYLPYMAYANQISVDSVGQAYTGEISLGAGLRKWGDALKDYGRQQGFTVK